MTWAQSVLDKHVSTCEFEDGRRFKAIELPDRPGHSKYFVVLYVDSDEFTGGYPTREEAVFELTSIANYQRQWCEQMKMVECCYS